MSYLEQLGENVALGLAKAGIMPADFANIGQALGQAGERRNGVEIDPFFIGLGLVAGILMGLVYRFLVADETGEKVEYKKIPGDTFKFACYGLSAGTLVSIIALDVNYN